MRARQSLTLLANPMRADINDPQRAPRRRTPAKLAGAGWIVLVALLSTALFATSPRPVNAASAVAPQAGESHEEVRPARPSAHGPGAPLTEIELPRAEQDERSWAPEFEFDAAHGSRGERIRRRSALARLARERRGERSPAGTQRHSRAPPPSRG